MAEYNSKQTGFLFYCYSKQTTRVYILVIVGLFSFVVCDFCHSPSSAMCEMDSIVHCS